jgi:hypothetical protein
MWGAALIANADGGMVMLESTGDPYQSVLDLAGATEGSVDVLPIRAGLEAAVGFYQSMDVATEESLTANLPSAQSAVELPRETTGNNYYSNATGKELSGKSAAAVGATLAGALLWANRKANAKDRLDGDMAS